MACRETKDLIEAYADGQLDLSASLDVERHLASCGACAADLGSYRALRTAIQGASLYHDAPSRLMSRVRASVRKEAAPPAARFRLGWRWAAAAAPAAAVVVVAWALVAVFRAPAAVDRLNEEIVSAHVRSLMGDHLMDFPSSDQHTVKPSFTGHLDFSPEVKDLSTDGFTLVGGRLDYLDFRPAAAVIYQRRRHIINLFVWPSDAGAGGGADGGAGSGAAAETSLRGYNLVRWTRGGLCYSAVSDINPAELREFRQAWDK